MRKVVAAAGAAAAAGGALLVVAGCLALVMPGSTFKGTLPPLTEAQARLRDRLKAHVGRLAGEIGERHVGRPDALEAAARYVREQLEAAGFAVEEQPYDSPGNGAANAPGPRHEVRNLEAALDGSDRAAPAVVVGAHYDTVPGTPGADDNASGVAGLLEVARMLRGSRPATPIRFIAFANEEPPFFQTDAQGSLVAALRFRSRGERIAGMLSLEMLGCYSSARNSQRYPAYLSWFYPDTADFILFVTRPSSRGLLRETVRHFRKSVSFPSVGAAVPASIEGVDWSDHSSFWEAGYPALMVTDTAFLRYPHYHEATDTPDRLDFDRMARVVQGLAGSVAGLAGARPPAPDADR